MIINFKKIRSSKKGFTLFTALVSLLLISITLILIFNMTQTEETYLSLISDQSSLSDLVTIADLSRADAYDTFIVSLRYIWEKNYSDPKNYFLLNRDLIDLDWDSFVQNVANEKFFSKDFAGVFAQTLLNNLKYTLHPSGYKVEVNTADHTYFDDAGNPITLDAEDTFKDIIRQLFSDGGNKVDIVNCTKDSVDECTGSFYLTLDTRNLSDVDYEFLPRVTVLRLKNNEVIERPVLGRQIYKIYMPWRGFQAYRIARRIAHNTDCETSDSPAFCLGDDGLFSAKYHNILEQARLGVCEPNTCGYRTNLFKTTSSNGFNGPCYKDFTVNVDPNNSINGISFNIDSASNYNSQNSTSYKIIFENLINNFVNLKLGNRTDTIVFKNSLKMLGSTVNTYNDLNILDNNISVLSQRTKQSLDDSGGSGHVSTISQSIFALNNTGINGSAGGLGIFQKDSDFNYGVRPYLIFKDWYSDYNLHVQGANHLFIGPDNIATLANLSCYELGYYSINLNFVEDNPRYLVDTSSTAYIRIRLTDNFVSYKFPPTHPYNLYVNNLGFLEGNLPSTINVNPTDWMCYSHDPGDDDKTCTSEN